MIRPLPVLLLTVGALSACAPTTETASRQISMSPELQAKARSVASYNLVDPDSAAFRNTRGYQLDNGQIAFCGERNARNRFGGFVGFQPFYVRFDPNASSDKPMNEQKEVLAQSVCTGLALGQSIPVRS